MKATYLFGLLIASSLILVSCKKEQEKQSVNTPESSTELTLDSVPQETPASSTSALNPAHGQPGHRCDIAVGAPLNTPISPSSLYQEPVIPNTPKTQVQQPANPIATPNTPRPKINPPHGQPHHDCKIQVGDPLPDA